MAMLSTETEKQLEDKIYAYDRDFFKYSRLAWAAKGNPELERKHLEAALESNALRSQVKAELEQLRGSNNPPLGGAARKPKGLPGAVKSSSTPLACSRESPPDVPGHSQVSPVTRRDQGVQTDSCCPQGSWGGASLDSSSGGSSSSSRHSAVTHGDAALHAPQSQQQVLDTTTDALEPGGADVPETTVLLRADGTANSCEYAAGSASARWLRRRKPWPVGGM